MLNILSSERLTRHAACRVYRVYNVKIYKLKMHSQCYCCYCFTYFFIFLFFLMVSRERTIIFISYSFKIENINTSIDHVYIYNKPDVIEF